MEVNGGAHHAASPSSLTRRAQFLCCCSVWLGGALDVQCAASHRMSGVVEGSRLPASPGVSNEEMRKKIVWKNA